MKTNEVLQQDVEDALLWEPLLDAAEIGVSVKNGIVTLSGIVDNYLKKMQAEKAAKNVAGVKAVVEEIEVRLPGSKFKSDFDIAEEVVATLNDNWNIPIEKIGIKVENGYVYLSGTIPWNYQKEAAKRMVQSISGVKDIVNLIQVEAEPNKAIDRQKLIDALLRHWAINATNIQVEVTGNTVTLKGFVSSLYQKEEAERVVWKTPGVMGVDNQLNILFD
ncbi:BON domain-containing protein [Flavobacterium sp.]|uniref:BON domain-containing protein n=1 Tax=Flavobacterium sp. TaxID=239 RepID=UPI00260BC034|nr:BON domain-containing protein [Flavobacterium sp.]